jgi:hypothetical protein
MALNIDPSVQSDLLLASYSANTGSQSAAIKLAYQVAPALGINIPGAGSLFAPTGKTITLILSQNVAPAPTTVTATSLGAGSIPKTQQSGPSTSNIVAVTLGYSPQSGDGYGQTVRYSQRARQSVHQTSGGFYVDQFGMGLGSLTLELIIAAQDGVVSKIQLMSALLTKAKLANPLQPGVGACTLTYMNNIDQTKLILTQSELEISQVAGDPGMARVTITGDVLRDFNATPSSAPAAATTTPTTTQSPLLSYSEDAVTTARGGTTSFA